MSPGDSASHFFPQPCRGTRIQKTLEQTCDFAPRRSSDWNECTSAAGKGNGVKCGPLREIRQRPFLEYLRRYGTIIESGPLPRSRDLSRSDMYRKRNCTMFSRIDRAAKTRLLADCLMATVLCLLLPHGARARSRPRRGRGVSSRFAGASKEAAAGGDAADGNEPASCPAPSGDW